MTEPISTTAVERIDGICDRFEAAWKVGPPPRVEDYLDGSSGQEREWLQLELLRVDEHYRQPAAADPTATLDSARPLRDRPNIAGYELLDELGRGGMGVVYLARQLRPNRLVALKVISAGTHAGQREVERFRCEADAIAQLQHPDIVQVYEVGEQNGCAYFALEYVAGGSLDRFLAGTPQPPHAAAGLVERLAQAIHHAHQRGIIHRDLKPANILIQRSAEKEEQAEESGAHVSDVRSPLFSVAPKITDFGLAKLLGSSAENRTKSGDQLGTPSYMAPEQVGGNTAGIGAATDVYGLGAVLYEVLTGRPPFRGATAMETLLQVQTVEPVSPSRLQPKCPRDLVTICLKCLSKQPRDRYESARELAEDLHRFRAGEPILARPVGPLQQLLKWTRRQPVVASLAVLLLLAVGLGIGTGSWFWWQAEAGLETAQVALEKVRDAQAEQVATLDRYQVALAHREWLANNVSRADALLDSCTEKQRQSWEWRFLDRLRRSAPHTFSGHSNTVQALAVHPFSREIVSASHDVSLRLWNLNTGLGRILGSHQSPVLAVAYSPDGRMLASSDSHHGIVKLWDMESGSVRELSLDGEIAKPIWALAFDSDNRYLAISGPRQVRIWDTRDWRVAYEQAANLGEVFQVAFSPNGRYLATASSEVRVWDWAAGKLQHAWRGSGARIHDLAFSPNGNSLASGGRDGLIRVHSLQTGKEEFSLNAHQLSVTSVTFSPDGKRLASAGQDGDMHVWNVNLRRRLFTLHGHSGAVWDLAYTRDGSHLISAGSDFLVRVWDASSSQEHVIFPAHAAGEIRTLAYGPGGRLLACGDRGGQIVVWDIELAQVVHRLRDPKLTDRNPVHSFAYSPDGRFLACRHGSGTVNLWDLDTGARIPLPDVAPFKTIGLSFSADGKQLLAASFDKGRLQVRDLLTQQELLTLTLPDRAIANVLFSPDAKLFLTIEERDSARVWDTDTGRLRGRLEHLPKVTCFALSDDARFFAIGGVGGRISVWDLTAKRETMAKRGHASNLYGLALSPDGHRLASAASDCTVKLWDTQTGHEVLNLRSQLHEHSPLAFSPDGADLASVTVDNQIQIWSTRPARKSP